MSEQRQAFRRTYVESSNLFDERVHLLKKERGMTQGKSNVFEESIFELIMSDYVMISF